MKGWRRGSFESQEGEGNVLTETLRTFTFTSSVFDSEKKEGTAEIRQ